MPSCNDLLTTEIQHPNLITSQKRVKKNCKTTKTGKSAERLSLDKIEKLQPLSANNKAA